MPKGLLATVRLNLTVFEVASCSEFEVYLPAHPRLGGAGNALYAVDARHAGEALLPGNGEI